MNDRWGFEEDDEPVVRTPPEPAANAAADDDIKGTDPDGVVTIAVTDAADVVSVKLKAGWRSLVSPRALHNSVLIAMNAATMLAVAKQAERIDMTGGEPPGTGAPPPTSEAHPDERPITKEDAMRLLDAVTADLDQYMRQVSAVADKVVATESGGGHVRVGGQHRQVTEVTIDANWASGAPDGEIESELRDVLIRFTADSSVGDLAQGPQSSAISELMNLVANPQQMVRRINQAR